MANIDKFNERNITIEASFDDLCFLAVLCLKHKLNDKVLNANQTIQEDLLAQYAESIVTCLVRTYSDIAPYSLIEIIEHFEFGVDSLIVLSREHEIKNVELDGYKVEVYDFLQNNNIKTGQEFTVGEFHGVVEGISELKSGPIYLITDLSRFDNEPHYLKM